MRGVRGPPPRRAPDSKNKREATTEGDRSGDDRFSHSVVYVPKGNLHAYRNAGEAAGRLLVAQTPGGVHERFFEEVGEPTAGGDTTKGALVPTGLVATAARYGIEMGSPF